MSGKLCTKYSKNSCREEETQRVNLSTMDGLIQRGQSKFLSLELSIGRNCASVGCLGFYKWWKCNVTWFLTGETTYKIPKCKKSPSREYILEKIKCRNFNVKMTMAMRVEVIIVTFLGCINDR